MCTFCPDVNQTFVESGIFMSSLDLLHNTKSPLSTSAASAEAELRRWLLRQNQVKFVDQDGAPYHLHSQLEILPHPDDTQAALYRISYHFNCQFDRQELLRLKVLSEARDKRLLQLLGEDTISWQSQQRSLSAPQLDLVRREFAESLLKFSRSLQKRSLNSWRKRMVGQWIDRKMLFGAQVLSHLDDKLDLDV